eukprot:1143132-Pelagomonas_calceolata.AAC.2
MLWDLRAFWRLGRQATSGVASGGQMQPPSVVIDVNAEVACTRRALEDTYLNSRQEDQAQNPDRLDPRHGAMVALFVSLGSIENKKTPTARGLMALLSQFVSFSRGPSIKGLHGRNTLQHILILRHLQHAAQIKRPNASPRLHAAFIGFKQGYIVIPREILWTHLQRICMLTCLLTIIKSKYVLVDNYKQARVHPYFEVKLSPLLFSLYINDVDCLAELCKGLLQRKGLVINFAKSEIVHFNSRGNDVSVFTLGGTRLACADSFKYLGMLLTKQRNFQAFAEHMCAPFLAGCRRTRKFASGYHLTDRSHTTLWLTRAHALPASRNGLPSANCALVLLECILGVKRTTPYWSVLRECGHESFKFYWVRAGVRFYNALLCSNSTTPDPLLGGLPSTLVTKIRHGLLLGTLLIPIDFFVLFLLVKGIHGASALGILFSLIDVGSLFTACVVFFSTTLARLRGVWNAGALAEHGEHMNKLAECHHWMARFVSAKLPPQA